MNYEILVSVSVPEIYEGSISTGYKVEAPNKTDAETIARERFKKQFPSITQNVKINVYTNHSPRH